MAPALRSSARLLRLPEGASARGKARASNGAGLPRSRDRSEESVRNRRKVSLPYPRLSSHRASVCYSTASPVLGPADSACPLLGRLYLKAGKEKERAMSAPHSLLQEPCEMSRYTPGEGAGKLPSVSSPVSPPCPGPEAPVSPAAALGARVYFAGREKG